MLREHVFERVSAWRGVRSLFSEGIRVGGHVKFHARHKLQLLAHSPTQCTALGRFVARARATAPDRLLPITAFTAALTTIVTRARHVNVLQHAAGYFRRVLPAAACRNVAAAILHYQRGDDPLVVPLRLIEHYARVHDVRYLRDQIYLDPYPHEVMLRNHV